MYIYKKPWSEISEGRGRLRKQGINREDCNGCGIIILIITSVVQKGNKF